MENMMDLEVFKGYEIEMLNDFNNLMNKLVVEDKKNMLEEFIMNNMEKEFLDVYDEWCDMKGG